MVARSRSATGPYQTLAEATGSANRVILEADSRWIAPGHNAGIEDAQGPHRILYHAVGSRRPKEKEVDDINSRRVMLIGELEWVNGWPKVTR